DAADQEVAAFVPFGVLVHGEPDLQPGGDQFAVVLVQVGDDVLQPGQGGLPGQFQQQVLLGAGDDHVGADRPAALADQGGHVDRAADQDTDGAFGVDLAVGEETYGAAPLDSVGQPADQRQVAQHVHGALDEGVRGERVRVRQQDGHVVV